MGSKNYYLDKISKNLGYPVYFLFDEISVLENTNNDIKEIIQVEPDYSNPDLKFTEYNNGFFATNYIIEVAKVPLLDITIIEKSLQKISCESFKLHKLYKRFFENNRLDLCDYLITKYIKLTRCSDEIILNRITKLDKDSLMYIINHNDFFQIRWEVIFKFVLSNIANISSDTNNEIIHYLMALINNFDHKIDYDEIIKHMMLDWRALKIKNIELFAELVDINYMDILKRACFNGNTEIIDYVLNKGIEYDFYELMKSDISITALKFFIDKGHYIDNIAINILINPESKNINRLIRPLVDQKILTQDLITKQLLETIIKIDIYSMEFLINDFDIISMVDLNMIMIKALKYDYMELIEWCINNGVNIDKYVSFVMKECCPRIFNKFIELGAQIPNDASCYNLKNIKYYCIYDDCIPYLKIAIKKEFDTADNIFNIIIDKQPHIEVLKYLLSEMTNEHVIVPKLTNVLIFNYYYCSKEYYGDLVKLNIRFNIEQQIIIQIIEENFIDAKELIFTNYDHHNNLKILFVTMMSNNIDMLEFLLEINKYDQDYLQWALIFSSREVTMFEYVINNTNIDPNSFKQEISTFAENFNSYSVDYLKLNGYYDGKPILRSSKLYKFMSDIDIFNCYNNQKL